MREPAADEELAAAENALRRAEGADAVAQAAELVLTREPAHLEALRQLALARFGQGRFADSVQYYTRAFLMAPDDPELARDLVSAALRAQDMHTALYATRRWCELAPDQATPANYLAGIYGTLGFEPQSMHWARQGAILNPVSPLALVKTPRLRVIALHSPASGSLRYKPKAARFHSAEGHNNLAGLLDPDHVAVHRLAVDALHERPEVLDALPQFDVVYNGITDPNRCGEALELAAWACEKLGKPVINPPRDVLATTREENARCLADIEDILVPQTIAVGCLEGDIGERVRSAAEKNGLKAPFIMRASGYQNGQHMYLIEDPDALRVRVTEPTDVYLLQFHDYSHEDSRAPGHRLYLKYRAFMVGGRLYPAHIRVGDGEWNVHMPQSAPTFRKFPWLYDVAEDFLSNPASHLPAGMWEKLEAALQRIELDYFGVDFALCTEPGNAGRLVIFEANASMRSFVNETSECTPENEAGRDILRAFHEHVCRRSAITPWAFHIPRGKKSPAREQGFADSAAEPVTRHLLFSGRVQGVGFREWYWHALHRYALRGWVRNLAGGRVEALVDGPEDAVAAFIDQCTGPSEARVSNLVVTPWEGERPEGVRALESAPEPAVASVNSVPAS